MLHTAIVSCTSHIHSKITWASVQVCHPVAVTFEAPERKKALDLPGSPVAHNCVGYFQYFMGHFGVYLDLQMYPK